MGSFTYCFASVAEYKKHGADSIVLNIHMTRSNVLAFFLELRLRKGRTMATYLDEEKVKWKETRKQ